MVRGIATESGGDSPERARRVKACSDHCSNVPTAPYGHGLEHKGYVKDRYKLGVHVTREERDLYRKAPGGHHFSRREMVIQVNVRQKRPACEDSVMTLWTLAKKKGKTFVARVTPLALLCWQE